MADEEHVRILKEGVKNWNLWRREHTGVMPDLGWAHLGSADLTGANLTRANLYGANLRGTDLNEANLTRANLEEANLLLTALEAANLTRADLRRADLTAANLRAANLTRARLNRTNFAETFLEQANMSLSRIGGTIFANVDLSLTIGLDSLRHEAPSSIAVNTLVMSGGKIPHIFLRSAGLPEPFISNLDSLIGAMEPIQFHSCFISYSNKDEEFAARLYADLQANAVRCFYAPEDLKIGARFRDEIERSIHVHEKLLLVLSANSIESEWVQTEVEAALEREEREKRDVLFPIRLDAVVMETKQAWAADIRRKRHIGNFTHWKEHDSYQKAFGRLILDLRASARDAGAPA